MDDITKVALSITTVAIIATVLVNANGAAKVISASTGGFGTALSAAEKG